jgi:transcriptional regulator with XRE-family HTH domain
LDAPTSNLIRLVRVQRGLTQKQAAALLGVHHRIWIFYEQGDRTLRWLRWVGWQVLADQGAEDYAHMTFSLPTPATFTALRARSRLDLEGLCELTRLPPDQWARCESLEVTAKPEFFRAFSVGLQLILECNNL